MAESLNKVPNSNRLVFKRKIDEKRSRKIDDGERHFLKR